MLSEVMKEVIREMIVELKMTKHERNTYLGGGGFIGFSGAVKAAEPEVISQAVGWSLSDWGILAGIIMVVINSSFQLFRLYKEVLQHKRDEADRDGKA